MSATAEEFSALWTYLGDNHESIPENQLVEAEAKLFDLKSQLKSQDVPYIMQHIDSHKVIQSALMDFLQ